MRKKVKKKWIKRLKSSLQTTGCLYDPNEGSYCCLGVLTQCYLDSPEGKGKAWGELSDSFAGLYGDGEDLPEEVVKWSGLDSSNPSVEVNEDLGRVLMTDLNDGYEFSFSKIAELIEKNL